MSAPVPVSCELSDAIREGALMGSARGVEPDIIAVDFTDAGEWILTDFTTESGEQRCWHVADGSRFREGAS